LTTSADLDVMPVWSPDGTQVAYRAGTLDKPTIGFAASDGSGVKRMMACPKSPCEPSDWSPDGGFLVLTVGGTDVWTMPVGSEGQARPLLAESFTERDARISPDGRWLAYVSDETGRPEVSVRRLTGPARRFVVSSGGGISGDRHRHAANGSSDDAAHRAAVLDSARRPGDRLSRLQSARRHCHLSLRSRLAHRAFHSITSSSSCSVRQWIALLIRRSVLIRSDSAAVRFVASESESRSDWLTSTALG
jgi:Tol biopolymer transport system component